VKSYFLCGKNLPLSLNKKCRPLGGIKTFI